nr:acyl carrier protein [Variovorax sp. S12S4]
MAQAEGNAAFSELGLDSLTLTQVATQIKKRFKVNLSFRQLMENYRSLDALGAFLRESLPAEPVAAVAAAPVIAPVVAPVSAAVLVPAATAITVPAAVHPSPLFTPLQAMAESAPHRLYN